jgi:signal transduction histidine kinase
LVRTSSAHRDLVYVTIVTAGAFLAVTATDLRETLVNWATAHPDMEWLGIEELPMGFALLGLATAWVAFRRWQQYSEENKAHLRALSHLNVAMNAVVAANQAMTRFLAAMSHELHTPLIVPGSFLIHLSPWLGNP